MIDLDKITSSVAKSFEHIDKRIIICAGTGCVANGSLKVYDAFINKAKEKGLKVSIELKEEKEKSTLLSKSGCQGFCQMGPLVNILPAGILYNKVKPEDVEEILEKSIKHDEIVERLCYQEKGKVFKGQEEIPFIQNSIDLSLNNAELSTLKVWMNIFMTADIERQKSLS